MPIRFYSRGKRKPPSMVVRPTRKRDEALQKQMAQAFQVDWVNGMKRLKQNVDSDTLANAYLSGDYGKIIKEVPFKKMPELIADSINRLQKTTAAGALRGASLIPDRDKLRYDLHNPRILKYMNTRQGFLIEGVNDEFHLTIQHLVQSRFAKGTSTGNMQMGLLDPVKRHGVAGFVLKNSLGLDTRSAGALANRAASGKFTQAQMDDYENELHVRRAALIARTETAYALNEGQHAVWDEAADQGLIDGDSAHKVWIVDGNPCPICEPMDGISVGLNENFLAPNGLSVPNPPLHPRCLCLMQLDVEGNDDNIGGSNRQNYVQNDY